MTARPSTSPATRVTDHPAVAGVLAEGRQAYLAVPSRRGPHATPALYSFAGGRIGVFVASNTLKARSVRKREAGEGLSTGLLVRTPTATALLSGPVRTFDALRPDLRLGNHLSAMSLGANFLLRNSVDLAAFARDTFRGQTGLPPSRRVLLAMTPTRAAVATGGGLELVGEGWPGPLDDRPAFRAEDDHVAVFETDSGLVPLPAAWDEDGGQIELARALADLVGVRAGAASVVGDEYTGPGPAVKKGRLVMGHAREVAGGDAGRARFRMDTSSQSDWQGTDVTTTRRSGTGPGAG